MKTKLLAALFALGATPAFAAPVTPKVSLDHDAVLAGEKNAVYVLLELDAKPAKKTVDRRPLNVALVIDRSCSMEDEKKMTYAKAAAKRLVDSLAPTDFVSIVEYDDTVTTLWPATPAESTRMMKRKIDRLSPRGGTNLTGGMMRGADQAEKNITADRINRVILLSDGLANEGVTDPNKIAKLVRARKKKGVQITTMGLGADYNEDLMQRVAETGGGRYYFIEHPTQIARIFEEEMSILATSLAKNFRVRFDGGDIVKKVEVFGYPSKTKGKQVFVEQEDFYAGETRSMLLRVELDPAKEGQRRLGTLLVEYLDLEAKRPRAIEKDIGLLVTADRTKVDSSRNDRVLAESTLIESDREQRESLKDYEAGNKARAKSRLARVQSKLSSLAGVLKDKRLSKKAQAMQIEAAEMDRADAQPQYKKFYVKKSKRRSFRGTKGKRGTYLLDDGASGYLVERLQKALKSKGMYAGLIDGAYDDDVKSAVADFQKKQGLEVDGVAGPMTLHALGLY